MNDPIPLNERAQLLLKTLVDSYVREGKPVPSQALLRESGLDVSSATVRNVLADLETAGLIRSPHTSAGRVPTAAGYRLFVDHLLTVKGLSDSEVDQIRQRIDPDADTRELMGRVSDMLSGVTQMAGLVMLPRREQVTLRQLEFLPLSEGRLLVIMVINEREVQNRIIHTGRQYTDSELQQAANYLNSRFAGVDLSEIRQRVLSEMQDARADIDQMMSAAIEVADKALVPPSQDSDYLVSGTTNLMSYSDIADIARMRNLFEAFQQKRVILDLLDRSSKAQGVQIFIGEESGYDALGDCSLITAPYTAEGKVLGVLGVIGPTRMAYDRMISVVDVTAKIVGSVLNSRG